MNNRGKFDKFDEQARKSLQFAQMAAARFTHNYIGTEHMLLGLLEVSDSHAVGMLKSMGVEVEKIRNAVEFIIGRGDRFTSNEIGLTARAKKVIELAVDEARQMKAGYIGTEHLLLGLIREGEGIAAGVLASVGVTLKNARSHTIALLGIRDWSLGAGGSSVKGFDVSSYHYSLLSSQRVEDTQPSMLPPNEARSSVPFHKFTERARRALSLAQEEAQRLQHNYIGTEHLLLALVRQQDGVASQVCKKLGVELDMVRTTVEFIIGRGDHIVLGEIQMTPRMKRVLVLAVEEASKLHHSYIGTEHLLLGIVHEGEGIAVGTLESLNVSLDRLHDETIKAIKTRGEEGTA